MKVYQGMLADDWQEIAPGSCFWEIQFRFSVNEMDDCVTFEVVTDSANIDKISVVDSVLDAYGGIAEMEDGTIINMSRFVSAKIRQVDAPYDKHFDSNPRVSNLH